MIRTAALLAILAAAGWALAGCTTPNGGTVTLPEIGGDVCYDVNFDKGAGAGRVCVHLTPGPGGTPQIEGPARITKG